MSGRDSAAYGLYFVFCSKTHTVVASINTPLIQDEDIENRESA